MASCGVPLSSSRAASRANAAQATLEARYSRHRGAAAHRGCSARASSPAALGVSGNGSSMPSTSGSAPGEAAKHLQLQLFSQVAGTNRGAIATLAQRRRIQRTIDDLAQLNEVQDLSQARPPLIDGDWELLYSTAEVFRSSPFFWAFQQGLVRDVDASAAIFAFTDAIPGADIGRAVQTIDLASCTLTSKVDMTVFPNIRGVVVTECSVTGLGQDLHVVVQRTRVEDSAFPFLDNVSVPVRTLVERVRGGGATAVRATVTYLDATMRVTQTEDGQLFVYSRV